MKASAILLAVITISILAVGCASHERSTTSAYNSSTSTVTSK